jgi:hypothetical protein
MQYTMKTVPSIAAAIAGNSPASSDDYVRADNPPAGGRRGGGNFEEFRQRMNERLKTSLKATDEEWSVLQPLMKKFRQNNAIPSVGRFGGLAVLAAGRPLVAVVVIGRLAAAVAVVVTIAVEIAAVQQNRRRWRDAVEKDGTAPEEIKAKLAASVISGKRRSPNSMPLARIAQSSHGPPGSGPGDLRILE